MRRRIVTVAMVLSALAQTSWLSAQAGKKPDPLIEALQGRWVIATVNGQMAQQDMGEFSLTFSGNTYKEIAGGQLNEEGTITVDSSKSPSWITLSIKTGQSAGQTQPGLVIVKGDDMQLSLTMPGNETRPASMSAAELQVTAKRVK